MSMNKWFEMQVEKFKNVYLPGRAVSKNNVLVALKNGQIRLFNEKNLINEITTEDTCNGIIYGIFGREDGCLVINH